MKSRYEFWTAGNSISGWAFEALHHLAHEFFQVIRSGIRGCCVQLCFPEHFIRRFRRELIFHMPASPFQFLILLPGTDRTGLIFIRLRYLAGRSGNAFSSPLRDPGGSCDSCFLLMFCHVLLVFFIGYAVRGITRSANVSRAMAGVPGACQVPLLARV